MRFAPPLVKPADGANWHALRSFLGIVDGDLDALASDISDLQSELHGYQQTLYYTSSGSFTKATYPWLSQVVVEAQAGGGSGAGAVATGAAAVSVGTGGCSGAYALARVPVASLAASETVTVGTGGAGASGSVGNSGTASSFGSHAVAGGGTRGTIYTNSSGYDRHSPPTPPTATAGDILIGGGRPEAAWSEENSIVMACPSAGADSMFGIGGIGGGAWPSTDGQNAIGYGAGGGGGANGRSQSARSGGDGGNGIVIVHLFA